MSLANDSIGPNQTTPASSTKGSVVIFSASPIGRAHTFGLAIAVVLLWAATGPIFGYSDAWQLVINTGTTIITFLMVFLLQHTQNRDTIAIQLKLDELNRVNKSARNRILSLEDMTEDELKQIKASFERLAPGDDGTEPQS